MSSQAFLVSLRWRTWRALVLRKASEGRVAGCDMGRVVGVLAGLASAMAAMARTRTRADRIMVGDCNVVKTEWYELISLHVPTIWNSGSVLASTTRALALPSPG